MSKAVITAVFERWRAACIAGDIDAVCALYAPDALFWGTISPYLRTSQGQVHDYFKQFLQIPPQRVTVDHDSIRFHGPVALHAGSYTFCFAGPQAKAAGFECIDARFSFAYEQQAANQWLIVEHHSSQMPQGGLVAH